jgi:hypothetical protein
VGLGPPLKRSHNRNQAAIVAVLISQKTQVQQQWNVLFVVNHLRVLSDY